MSAQKILHPDILSSYYVVMLATVDNEQKEAESSIWLGDDDYWWLFITLRNLLHFAEFTDSIII